MIVDHEINRKFSKTGLELKDLFEEKNFLFNHWVLKNSLRNLTVGAERAEVSKIFDQLRERASSLDKSLAPFVAAEGQRTLNSLEKIERNLVRAEKRLHADKFRQIENVKDALFPGETCRSERQFSKFLSPGYRILSKSYWIILIHLIFNSTFYGIRHKRVVTKNSVFARNNPQLYLAHDQS